VLPATRRQLHAGSPRSPDKSNLKYPRSFNNDTEARFAAHYPLIGLALSSGKISFIDCTPVDALNLSASCESIDVPEHPSFHRPPPDEQNRIDGERTDRSDDYKNTVRGQPAKYHAHRFGVVTVTITTFAPPNLFSSAVGFFS
jgi:hypothetical protein